jgi:putative membrane protein
VSGFIPECCPASNQNACPDCAGIRNKADAQNEVAYHQQVNGALQNTLIPNASNSELKDLLSTGLKIFQGHQQHAEHLVQSLPARTGALAQ